MADEKSKRPLPQEEIDKAVTATRGGHGELGEEVCEDHLCSPDFKCNEPFYNLGETKSQVCGGHSCEPNYECVKPFGCSPAHISD